MKLRVTIPWNIVEQGVINVEFRTSCCWYVIHVFKKIRLDYISQVIMESKYDKKVYTDKTYKPGGSQLILSLRGVINVVSHYNLWNIIKFYMTKKFTEIKGIYSGQVNIK